MTFEVVIPVFNQHDRTAEYVRTWFEKASGLPHITLFDNGSDTPAEDHPGIAALIEDYNLDTVRSETNIGVFPSFPRGMGITTEDWVFFSHSDVEMVEYGWDTKLNNILRSLPAKAGVCGMFGAEGLGTLDIYKTPYIMHQLQRWNCVTVKSMDHGGARMVEAPFERVLTLDGFSMIVNRKMADEVGFDVESYPPHHCYDNDICLAAHFAGWKNYVLDIDCIHHGGMTSCAEPWAEEWDTTDLDVHKEAHKVFYKKYHSRLPACIPGVSPWLTLNANYVR
jgi:GT2 family glycosyltransferase